MREHGVRGRASSVRALREGALGEDAAKGHALSGLVRCRWRIVAILCIVIVASGCGQRGPAEEVTQPLERPEQAGQPMDSLQTAGRLVSIRAAAILGDQAAVRANMDALHEDFRKSIKLADPARAVDREAARAAAKDVDGVRSVAWIDRENLMVIVSSIEARSYDVIDAICMQLEPLGDTLGVVVNLQSGAATNSDELAVLSRNCQLAPGDRAMLQRNRQIDVVSESVRSQHKRNNAAPAEDAEQLRRRQDDAMRILEASTPEL
jgi:hypothetical protein